MEKDSWILCNRLAGPLHTVQVISDTMQEHIDLGWYKNKTSMVVGRHKTYMV